MRIAENIFQENNISASVVHVLQSLLEDPGLESKEDVAHALRELALENSQCRSDLVACANFISQESSCVASRPAHVEKLKQIRRSVQETTAMWLPGLTTREVKAIALWSLSRSLKKRCISAELLHLPDMQATLLEDCLEHVSQNWCH